MPASYYIADQSELEINGESTHPTRRCTRRTCLDEGLSRPLSSSRRWEGGAAVAGSGFLPLEASVTHRHLTSERGRKTKPNTQTKPRAERQESPETSGPGKRPWLGAGCPELQLEATGTRRPPHSSATYEEAEQLLRHPSTSPRPPQALNTPFPFQRSRIWSYGRSRLRPQGSFFLSLGFIWTDLPRVLGQAGPPQRDGRSSGIGGVGRSLPGAVRWGETSHGCREGGKRRGEAVGSSDKKRAVTRANIESCGSSRRRKESSVRLAVSDLPADAAQEPQHLLTRRMGSQNQPFGAAFH